MFQSLPSHRGCGKLSWGAGGNLGLAGVVLLLNRRDKRRFLFFCYASRQAYVEVNDTYSEGGTHEETQHPQSKARVKNKGQGD